MLKNNKNTYICRKFVYNIQQHITINLIMLDFIEKALQSPAGSFGFVFSIIALLFFVIWKVSHFSTKFSSVEKLENNIDSIKENIHSIKAYIEVNKNNNNPLAQRQSPISLTQKGKEVADELNVEQIIANHWEKINREVQTQLKSDCNPYDIQVASFKIGDNYQKYLTEEELNKIKIHAFNVGFNLDIYNIMFGIVIRDKVLKDKGYNSNDVDKYDPNKI